MDLDDIVTTTSELIQIDTTNYGPAQAGPGERAAAEYVAARLESAGLTPLLLEAAPGRTSVVANWSGRDDSQPALLIHGHLDVVPAEAADWRVAPFAGAVEDDCVWGRGAVDMKDFDAVVLSTVAQMTRAGQAPRRTIRLVFTADEEAGGGLGAIWLAETHPELIADCREAVGEVGGFSLTVAGRRLYLIETAEKGLMWLNLVAEGTAGHASMRQPDNAVTTLARAVAALGDHRFPVKLHPAQRAFLDAVSTAVGADLTSTDPEATLARLGSIARMIGAAMSNTVNPSMLQAGYKVNVVPGQASAAADGRFLPGERDDFLDTVKRLVSDRVRVEITQEQPSVEAPWGTPLTEVMERAIRAYDPEAGVTPYLLSAGTDAKGWSRLGLTCYGFTPLKLPADLDFTGLFHGVDERVPIESLAFAGQVFERFLTIA